MEGHLTYENLTARIGTQIEVNYQMGGSCLSHGTLKAVRKLQWYEKLCSPYSFELTLVKKSTTQKIWVETTDTVEPYTRPRYERHGDLNIIID